MAGAGAEARGSDAGVGTLPPPPPDSSYKSPPSPHLQRQKRWEGGGDRMNKIGTAGEEAQPHRNSNRE